MKILAIGGSSKEVRNVSMNCTQNKPSLALLQEKMDTEFIFRCKRTKRKKSICTGPRQRKPMISGVYPVPLNLSYVFGSWKWTLSPDSSSLWVTKYMNRKVVLQGSRQLSLHRHMQNYPIFCDIATI